MPSLIFNPGKELRLHNGHPWVYEGEVETIRGTVEDGDIVELRDAHDRFLGQGYVNRRSQIIARLLTTSRRPVDADFFRQRIGAAIAFRNRFVHGTNAYRVVYSESDLLPGLIVDRYGPYLAVQVMTLGMARWKETVLDVLTEALRPEGIYERSDVSVREHEGLPQTKGLVRGSCPAEARIEEGNTTFLVDLVNGQKTGFFLDQRENRAAVRRLTAGARVLDGFCYTGGFGLAAAAGGAVEVTGIDLSASAVAMAERNAALNQMADRCRFRVGNMFDELRTYEAQRTRFDVIILDPPSFTRSKSSLAGATRGYKEINLRAMKLLTPGGYLATCSCSYHMTEPFFREMLVEAARDAERTARIVETRTQATDHPILLAARETQYLKCFILQVF